MKDRLQAALTALDPFLDDALEAMASDPENDGACPSIGLWECPGALARNCLAAVPNLTVSARNDGRGPHLAMVEAGARATLLHDALQSSGANHAAPNVDANDESVDFDSAAIVLPVPSRELTFGLIAAASRNAAPGAPILMAGTKDQGIETVAKRLKERGINVEKRSKAHAIALRFTVPHDVLEDWMAPCQASEFEETADRIWVTAPGVFSHGRIDRGSLVLRKHMPTLSNRVADFGGGWGALVPTLLERGAARVDLFEESATALHLAKLNLADLPADKVAFHWHDLVAEPMGQTFDHVVMNPPFHTGKTTSANLGAAFIDAAHRALRPGGSLTLVANVHLGYEHTLAGKFGNCEQLAREDGFKILRAFRKRS
ncbi:MAG: class I SAM-dependent methyltransferase [Pseudomonadota bacterium]